MGITHPEQSIKRTQERQALVVSGIALFAVGVSLSIGTPVRFRRETDGVWSTLFTLWQTLGFAQLGLLIFRAMPVEARHGLQDSANAIERAWTNDWGLVDVMRSNHRGARLGVRSADFPLTGEPQFLWMSVWCGLEVFLGAGLVYGAYGAFLCPECRLSTVGGVSLLAAFTGIMLVLVERWASQVWSPRLGQRWQMVGAVSPVVWPAWWFSSLPVRDAAVFGACFGILAASTTTKFWNAPVRRIR